MHTRQVQRMGSWRLMLLAAGLGLVAAGTATAAQAGTATLPVVPCTTQSAPAATPQPVPTGPDTIAPNPPIGVRAYNITPTSATLAWWGSSDNIGVTGFEVWGQVGHCGWMLVTTDTTPASGVGEAFATVTLLPPPEGTLASYAFYVKAVDAAGNVSVPSPIVYVTPPSAQASTSPSGSTAPTPPAYCRVRFVPTSQSAGGFTADVTVTNISAVLINGWMIAFRFPGDQKILSVWNAAFQQTGADVTVTSLEWNRTIPPSESASFGMRGTTSSGAWPTSFSLNGIACSAG